MNDFLKDIEADIAARHKLERIANGANESLTTDEARRLLSHQRWLDEQRKMWQRHFPCDD